MPVLFTASRGILWGPQGDHIPPVLKTLQRLISLPVKAKVLTKMCHLFVSISSHSPHRSFHSSHNTLPFLENSYPAPALESLHLLLPLPIQLSPQIAACFTTLVFQVCSQMFSNVSSQTTECEKTVLPKMLPDFFPGFIYFFLQHCPT